MRVEHLAVRDQLCTSASRNLQAQGPSLHEPKATSHPAAHPEKPASTFPAANCHISQQLYINPPSLPPSHTSLQQPYYLYSLLSSAPATPTADESAVTTTGFLAYRGPPGPARPHLQTKQLQFQYLAQLTRTKQKCTAVTLQPHLAATHCTQTADSA